MMNQYQLLSKFLEYCRQLYDSVIIVEGKQDRKTLEGLNLTSKIIEKGGLSINELVDMVFPYSTIIILTDFDKEGKWLRREIKREIQHRKGHGKIDSNARHILYQFCRKHGITEIENLDRYYITFINNIKKFSNSKKNSTDV